MAFYFQCSSDGGANTGVGRCKPQFADIVGIILLKKGTEVLMSDLTATSVTSFLTNNVITRKAFPIPRVVFKAVSTPETKSKEISGKMQYYGEAERRATFTLLQVFGCLQQELTKLNNGNYSAIFVDSTGAFLGREGTNATKIKGFTLSQIWFENIKPFVAYGEVAEQDVMITIDPTEFESVQAYGNLGYPVDDMAGIVGVNVAKVSATTSSIVVTTTESCNTAQPISGLLASNFALSQAGLPVAITGVVEDSLIAGQYAIATTITENPFTLTVVPTVDDMFSAITTFAYA